MSTMMPEGEAIRSAVKWISEKLKEDPDRTLQPLLHEALLRFDLSPKDAEFLMAFYRKGKTAEQA